ncbi:hypothetical protein KAM447_09020 [Aeromonas caviae]|nr:hypothetical protein KAM643c_42330 [Aeromonas caviae]GJC00855.1 hypothetical protein KAM384_21360 [Aeromonas caviae]GKQ74394.1 hypothetical protein KAM447_09020 [Aeromonas caviae]GKR78085.1 hypothetical protein KAM481_15550 [Aeromonas caviae]
MSPTQEGPITNIFIVRLLSGLARLLIITGRDYAPRKAEEITEDTRLLPQNAYLAGSAPPRIPPEALFDPDTACPGPPTAG